MRTILKAAAFVIRTKNGKEPELLLFTHADHPSVPHQIPGGGVEPGEQPYAAAVRELEEEAGLSGLPFLRVIGVSSAPAHGETDAQVERHCYLFDGQGRSDHWVHCVTGSGEDRALHFEYRWYPRNSLPPLAGSQGYFLNPKALPELFLNSHQTSRDNPSPSFQGMLRSATPADAPAIARIHVETWRSAYRDIIPADFLKNLSIQKRAEGWEKNLCERRDHVLVAEKAGEVVGWVSYGPCRDEYPGDVQQAEIYAIYVASAQHRTGIGSALMKAAEQQLATLIPSSTRFSLWVLARNEPTRRFYEGLGYRHRSREKQEQIGGELFIELRYEKPVTII